MANKKIGDYASRTAVASDKILVEDSSGNYHYAAASSVGNLGGGGGGGGGSAPSFFVTVGFSDDDTYTCDGVADDVQIQQAVDDLTHLLEDVEFMDGVSLDFMDGTNVEMTQFAGGTILLKDGTYDIRQRIVICTSNLTIRGESLKTQLKLGAYVNEEIFVVGNGRADDPDVDDPAGSANRTPYIPFGVVSKTHNVSFETMTLDGNKEAQEQDNAVMASIEYGVSHTRNLLRYRSDAQNSYGGHIWNVVAQNGMQNGLSCESHLALVINACRADNNENFGIWAENGRDVFITDNNVINNSLAGVKVLSHGELTFSGNHAQQNKGANFSFQSVGRSTIMNNNSHRAGWRGGGVTPDKAKRGDVKSDGFQFSSCYDNLVVGNAIYASYGNGMSITGSSRNSFSHNSFRRNGQLPSGVVLNSYNDVLVYGGACTDNIFAFNTFENDNPTYYDGKARHNYAFDPVSNSHTGNQLFGNRFGQPDVAIISGYDQATKNRVLNDLTVDDLLLIDGGTTSSTEIKTSQDGNSAILQRSETNGEFKLKNTVAGPAATPHSLEFDGATQHATISDFTALSLPGDFTISFWVKLDTLTGEIYVLNRSSWRFTIRAGGQLRFTIPGVADISDPGSELVTTGSWQHVAIKRTGTTYSYHRNGVTSGTNTNAAVPTTSTDNLLISRTSATYATDGKLDDIRIYSRALSDAEINTTLYGGGDPATTNLEVHIHGNEGSGTSAADISGNGRNATLKNGVTFSTDVPAATPGDTQADVEVDLITSVDNPSIGAHGINTFGDADGKTVLAGATVVNNAPATPVTSIDNTDSPYTATATDHTILGDATGGAITVNLPTAVGIDGRTYTIKKVDASGNAVTVDGDGSETIDGAATNALSTQWDSVTVQSDGANWVII